VTLHHPEARRIVQALAARGVITDYRSPDRVRFGLAPITTRFTDVWDAITQTRQIVEAKAYEDTPAGSAG
jgi:kynureninase